MVSNLPTLPPAFLESCLAFSKQLYAMKTGVAKLEASPSHFLFSVDHSPGNKETGNFTDRRWKIKKKTPSDLRRDARRSEKFLEEKKNSYQPAASASTSSSNPTQSTDQPSPADLSLISETSMIVENSDVMETESSAVVTLVETLEVPVTSVERTVISTTRNESNEVPVNESRNLIEIDDEASAILPDLPPQQQEKLHEVHIMICAPSKSAAKKRSKEFPKSKMIDSHPSNRKHHFIFSTNVNDEYISKLKNNINKFDDLLHLNVISTKEDFHPDQDSLHHCQNCKSSGIYHKWLEAQTFSD